MPSFPPVEEQLKQIRRGVEEILPEEALKEKLTDSREAGEPLTIKLGCDPSRPDLHIGHAVVLRKLRQFQDLGHRVVLVVGDFTAMIGDPSGRSKTRPALSMEETRRNGETYFEQASIILDEEKTSIVYNSNWLDEMTFSEVIELASHYTVARMLERDDFHKRYAAGKPIAIHEFLYPLAQAQDSVELEADVELGGTDQKFNLLVARDIQQVNDQDAQVCITLPLLEGTDGVEKMSKSLDNYIGLQEAPEEMYGKVLSIPDELIYRYFTLATDVPTRELPVLQKEAAEDPRNAKHKLAHAIVRMYHGVDAAESAREHFEKTVIEGDLPDDIEEFRPDLDSGEDEIGLLNLMRQLGFVESNSEARRLIKQNAVSIDGEKVTDPYRYINVEKETPLVLKVGKRRYARVVWNDVQGG
jgi:tyrosyl-tRNA synthetase